VIAVTDDGDEIPGKQCGGFWGWILTCKKPLVTDKGVRIVTRNYKTVEGFVTLV
jgi:hypothetical protein